MREVVFSEISNEEQRIQNIGRMLRNALSDGKWCNVASVDVCDTDGTFLFESDGCISIVRGCLVNLDENQNIHKECVFCGSDATSIGVEPVSTRGMCKFIFEPHHLVEDYYG